MNTMTPIKLTSVAFFSEYFAFDRITSPVSFGKFMNDKYNLKDIDVESETEITEAAKLILGQHVIDFDGDETGHGI